MKRIITAGFMCIAISLAACSGTTDKKLTEKNYKYVCTMHSDIGADKPGACPKCGMDLVERDTTE